LISSSLHLLPLPVLLQTPPNQPEDYEPVTLFFLCRLFFPPVNDNLPRGNDDFSPHNRLLTFFPLIDPHHHLFSTAFPPLYLFWTVPPVLFSTAFFDKPSPLVQQELSFESPASLRFETSSPFSFPFFFHTPPFFPPKRRLESRLLFFPTRLRSRFSPPLLLSRSPQFSSCFFFGVSP